MYDEAALSLCPERRRHGHRKAGRRHSRLCRGYAASWKHLMRQAGAAHDGRSCPGTDAACGGLGRPLPRRHGATWICPRRLPSDPQRLAPAVASKRRMCYADLSKNLWHRPDRGLAAGALAHDCGWQAQRDAMLAGAADQHHRAARRHALAAAHAARWRAAAPAPGGAALAPGAVGHPAAVHDTLNAMLALAEQVRADRQITDIVNIGIGGSHLGRRGGGAWAGGLGGYGQARSLCLERGWPRAGPCAAPGAA